MSLQQLLAILMAVALVTVPAYAQDDSEDDDEEFDFGSEEGEEGEGDDEFDFGGDDETFDDDDVELGPHPDVVTNVVFPDLTDEQFPIGEDIDVLLGFKNSGDKTFNVSLMTGSINSPQDFNYFVQNFTEKDYSSHPIFIKPGQEVTLLYTFKPSPNLEPMEFGMAHQVFYTDEDGVEYASSYFNATVELVEAKSEMSTREVATFGLVAAAVCVLGVFTLGSGSSSSKESDGEFAWAASATPASKVGSPRSPTRKSRKA